MYPNSIIEMFRVIKSELAYNDMFASIMNTPITLEVDVKIFTPHTSKQRINEITCQIDKRFNFISDPGDEVESIIAK